MNNLFFLLVFIVLAFMFAVASVVAAFVVGYHSDYTDNSTYECGMKLFGDAPVKFDCKFLNYAVLFLIFDVASILLFPLAINFIQFKSYVLIEGLVFLLLLMFTLYYSVKKNLLRWQK